MNNTNYDFMNTGYKIHLPAVPDINDPLTKRIAEFLDKKFGTTEADRFGYKDMGEGRKGCYSTCYKIGNCSDALEDGKGITIYGKQATADEMRTLANEIEAKFGNELAENLKKYNIKPTPCDTNITKNVTGRFAASRFGILDSNNNLQHVFTDYNQTKNPSGALTKKVYKNIKGELKGICVGKMIHLMSDIDKKFLTGDSTMAMLDNFGELFTGKIENNKVPEFVMDGLPEEYLKHYGLSEKDIISRINGGTEKIAANMLEDIAEKGRSSALLRKNAKPWITELEPQVLTKAKQLLAKHNPQAFQKLEKILPQLEKSIPALSVLNKPATTIADEVAAKWRTRPVTEVKTSQVSEIFGKLKGKTAILLSGLAVIAAGATYFSAKSGHEISKPSPNPHVRVLNGKNGTPDIYRGNPVYTYNPLRV